MTAIPSSVAESARRIVARVDAGRPMWSEFDRDTVAIARWVLERLDAPQTEWRPVLAGGPT